MTVTCGDCGMIFDDTNRLTYCPHQCFEMNTTVAVGGKVIGVAHSIEEFERLMKQAKETR